MNKNTSADFLKGVKIAFPVIIGYIPLGFACGVVLQSAGLTVLQIALMSLLVFAGAGQYIAAGMIVASSPLTIGITIFIINLRHILYTSSLIPYIGKWTSVKKYIFASEITDETFALHSSMLKENETLNYNQAMGINIASHSAWVLGTILGAILGSVIPSEEAFAIDFALPALFIALILPRLTHRPQLVAAVIATILTIIFTSLDMSYGGVILTAVLTSIITYIIFESKK